LKGNSKEIEAKPYRIIEYSASLLVIIRW